MSGRRANREGSIYHRGYDKSGRDLGWAAYVWVEKPSGGRTRKYVYARTREEAHAKWIELHRLAKAGPVSTEPMSIERYMRYWLEEVVRPHRSVGTYDNYERFARLFIIPGVGVKKLRRLRSRELQTWINQVARTCQCCIRGLDENRSGRARCCAMSPKRCCGDYPSSDTLDGIRKTIRAMWNHAKRSEEVSGNNPAEAVELAPVRRGKQNWWSSKEAGEFLRDAKERGDPLYAAYVLVVTLGLRKGEVLGLTWNNVDLTSGELTVESQLQRRRGQLYHGQTKTQSSAATLPLPEICVTALRYQQQRQRQMALAAGAAWHDRGFVFTTHYGSPIEPRNFNRSFDAQCERSGIRRIRVHDARRTCASLLADLDVHPRVAMQILRHAKFSMTMEVYTEVSSKTTREALRRLGEELG